MSKKIKVVLFINILLVGYFLYFLTKFHNSNSGTEGMSNSWYFNFPIQPAVQTKNIVTSQFRADVKRSGNYVVSKNGLEPSLKWIKRPFNSEVHTASKSTPAVDDSGIYLGSDTGVMYAFDFEGNEKWRFKTDSDVRGIHGTALVDGENLFFGSYSGFFYSLNKLNGKVNWISKLGHAVGSSAMIVKDMLIVSAEFDRPREGHLVALNIHDGKLIWKSNFFGEQVHSSPAYSEATQSLGVGGNNGIFWAIDLYSGITVWKENFNQPIKSTAVVINGKFCFSSWDQKLHCLDAETGESVTDFLFKGRSQSSPAALDDSSVIVSSTDGFIYKIEINDPEKTKSRDLKSGQDTTNYGMSSPIVISSQKTTTIVTACEKTFLCFLDKNLELKNKVNVGSFSNGSLTVFKESLYGATTTGGFFRIDL